MSATIIPLRRGADANAVQLATTQRDLERRREELLGVIAKLRASPAAGRSDDLGRANADLDAAARRALALIEGMLDQAGSLAAVVRA